MTPSSQDKDQSQNPGRFIQLLPLWLTSKNFRLGFTSGVSANQVCFERELLDHYRLVFERT
jgi:cyclopropane-fatty-acyl-phospholipid synthase